MKLTLSVILAFIVSGCAVKGSERFVPGLLCNEPHGRDDRFMRLSYERLPMFMTGRCSKRSDISYDKVVDSLSMSTLRSFQSGNAYMESASLQLRISGNTGGSLLEEALSPEEFARYHEDTIRRRALNRLERTDWVERAGLKCVRFTYSFWNRMRKMQELDYWCWESESGVSEPFNVSALEAVGPYEEFNVDLEREIFDPFFASLQLKRVSPDVLARIERQRQEACLKHQEYFDRKGKGWVEGDFPDHRRALRILKSCGYDVEVPPHDGQVLEPNLNNLYR